MIGSDYFKSRSLELLGAEECSRLFLPGRQSAARGLSVNTLRLTATEFAARAAARGEELEPSPFYQNGFLLGGQTGFNGTHPYHHAGVYYLQEPSAASAAGLLGVQPGERVLDLCAAPGGKSSQLAGCLKGQGVLFCNEYVAARAGVLASTMERMGVPNAVVTVGDTARLAEALPGWFDRVLVDAPCSGEGMFLKEPQAVDQHNEGLVRSCAALGATILDNAAACTAPGGTLVYSTCTFSPEEDEGNIALFLARHPDFALVDAGLEAGCGGHASHCIHGPLPVEMLRRIYPCHGGEGHFIAKMVRTFAGQAQSPRRAKKGLRPAPCPRELSDFMAEYLPGLPVLQTLIKGENITLLPPGLPALEGLSVLRCGVPAGAVSRGRFTPHHSLFTAFGALFANREELTLDDARCRAYLRGEEIDAVTARAGWCAVTVDGCPMGGGKVSGGVVKNHYPKGLRNYR